jgi:hypothetical protein
LVVTCMIVCSFLIHFAYLLPPCSLPTLSPFPPPPVTRGGERQGRKEPATTSRRMRQGPASRRTRKEVAPENRRMRKVPTPASRK